MKKDSVLVICAHSDDEIFGPGGTIAKYAQEGKKVYSIIFSFGETTHIHLKKPIAVKMRVKEAKEADKVIGGKGVRFLGLNETKFEKEAKEKDTYKKLKQIITEKKPAKIFTHSIDDPHTDHRAVYKIVTDTYDSMRYKCDVYSFDVWNPINFRKRDQPKLYVDITDTFKTKLSALRCFESQKIAMITLLWSVYLRAIINGLHNHCKYAERFYKIR
jgi:LmbE family N-acetylglucosaminyl deacetylase